MQNLPIYLYPNSLDVLLDLDSTVRGVNRVMYQRHLKIQKGIKNQIRVQFKNSDQKKISISTGTFVFSMFDSINHRTVIEKPIEILETNTSTRGLGLLTLNESDTLDLNNSVYNFAIKKLEDDGSFTPTYSNTYYGVAGTAEVLNDAFPQLVPSQEVIAFQKSFNGTTMLYEHKSGNIYANPEYQGNIALHTLAAYLTGYRGTVYIQGTLQNSPASFDKYFTIATKTYNNFTGVDYFNFNGVFSYIRVMHIPATAPAEVDNDNPAYYGRFDKFLYRS